LINPSEGVVITATDYSLAIFGIIAGVLGLVGAGLIFFRALGTVLPRMKPGIRPVGALWPVLVLLGGLAAGMFLIGFGKYSTVIAIFFLPITAMLLYMYGWSNDSRGGYAASFFVSGLHSLLIVIGLLSWFHPIDFWNGSPFLDSIFLGQSIEMLFTRSAGYYVFNVVAYSAIFVSMLGIAWYSLRKFNSLPDPVAEAPEETK